MAFMNQERKRERMPAIKAALSKYGMKGSVSVRSHSTLVVTLKEGPLDFGYDKGSVNHYWINEHYEGQVAEFLTELRDAMLGHDFYDNSEIMTDYFDVSHYIFIDVGRWDKPYLLKELV